MSSEKACLEFQNIGMEFPGVKALSDVSFSIGQGEIHALMGANGAGKSTLIKILARVYQQTSGDILLHGACPSLRQAISVIMGSTLFSRSWSWYPVLLWRRIS